MPSLYFLVSCLRVSRKITHFSKEGISLHAKIFWMLTKNVKPKDLFLLQKEATAEVIMRFPFANMLP